MQEIIEKAISDYKESEECSTNLAKYYYTARMETVDCLRPKNPNLDASDMEENKVSQEGN